MLRERNPVGRRQIETLLCSPSLTNSRLIAWWAELLNISNACSICSVTQATLCFFRFACGTCPSCLFRGGSCSFLTFLSVSVAMHATVRDVCMTCLNKFTVLCYSSHKSLPVAEKIVPHHIKTSALSLNKTSLSFHQAMLLYIDWCFVEIS